MRRTRTRTKTTIVTETVIGRETRDAKGTATAGETGTVTDGTPVCLSPVTIAFAIADNYIVLFLIVARSRRGGGGDHWEPQDRERRNDVRSLVLSLHFSHILTLSLASTALALAFTTLSLSFPFTASLGFAQPPSFASFAISWRLFAQPFTRARSQAVRNTPALSWRADKCTARRSGRVRQT